MTLKAEKINTCFVSTVKKNTTSMQKSVTIIYSTSQTRLTNVHFHRSDGNARNSPPTCKTLLHIKLHVQ